MRIRVKGSAIDVTTANNVDTATLVRAFAASAATVTIATSAPVTIGTFKMPAGSVELIEKDPTDTIASTATLSCTKVATR